MSIRYVQSVLALVLLSWATFGTQLLAQNATVRGRIADLDNEPLMGAMVVVEGTTIGAYTNEDGIYSLNKVPAGKVKLRLTYIGFDTLRQEVEVPSSGVVTVNLQPKVEGITTAEVLIEAVKFGKIDQNNADPGLIQVASKDIARIPTLGTPDLAQYLQVIPGAVFTGDQGGGLYIRGGTPIMNMVIMDGAIIYAPFHSLGLFSVFDTDIIRSADVYTAGFPAEYGGRLSSVVDITTRNGSFSRFKGKAHLNPITAGAVLEGPLFKSKGEAVSSFLLSGRGSYLNETSKTLYQYASQDENGLPFSFADFYGKLTFGSSVNNFTLFGYHHRDRVAFESPLDFAWTASGGGLNFRVLPSQSQAIISGMFAISNYQNQQVGASENFPRESGINGFNSRLDFTYILKSVNRLSYGLQILGFSTTFRSTNSLGLVTAQDDNNTEFAAYFSYKHAFQRKAYLDDGGGYVPAFTRAVFEPSLRGHFYNNHSYFSIEPRLRFKYNFRGWSLNLGSGRYSQNLVAAISDRDVVQLFQGFLTAPDGVADLTFDHPLQVGWHYLAGLELELLPGLRTNLEGWYKDFQQLTNINRNRLFQDQPRYITETGQAYGADLSLTYQREKLYLYATYGWAKVLRTDPVQTYHPVYDRRHTVNTVASYGMGAIAERSSGKFIDRAWEFSVRWTLGSGFPFILTQAFFERLTFVGNGSQTDYLNQNGELGVQLDDDLDGGRQPWYHRLDVSIRRRFRTGNAGVLEISANAINLYDRQNLFYFDRITNTRRDQLPIMPTMGLEWRF